MGEDPDILVDLMAVSSDFEGEVIINALEAEGIPARMFSAAARTLVVTPAMPFRVQVRRGDLQRAREALDRTRADSVDIDWDEVDLGESASEARFVANPNRWAWMLALSLVVIMGLLFFVAMLTPTPRP